MEAPLNSTQNPRIFLIHATHLAIPAIQASFDSLWPEARIANLLDDSLAVDLERLASITPSLIDRFECLAKYAWNSGAQGILFTCSAFGEAINACRLSVPVPVLKPNEAMIDDALKFGDRIALLATFEPAIKSMTAEFEEVAQASGRKLEIHSMVVPNALEELRKGNTRAHDELIMAAAKLVNSSDVICVAQFSMTSAAKQSAAASSRPVLTTPDSAVLRLRRLLVD